MTFPRALLLLIAGVDLYEGDVTTAVACVVIVAALFLADAWWPRRS